MPSSFTVKAFLSEKCCFNHTLGSKETFFLELMLFTDPGRSDV